MSIRKSLLSLFFLIVPLVYSLGQDTLQARSAKDLLNLSLEEFMNVVITPSKLPQSEESITQKVDVISKREMNTAVLENRNICEAISRLSGVSVSVLSRNDANWGTYSGIGPKYSTYMLQGLPVDAFIDPMSLDLYGVDRIEVQRGPASIVYPNYLSQDFAGNQSPLAGTVNLILKSRIESENTEFGLSYGSYNTLNGSLYHENHKGRLNYFAGISSELSDYTNYGSPVSWLNMKKNPDYRKTKLFGGVTLFLDTEEKEKLSVFYQTTVHSGDAGRIYRGFRNDYTTVNAGYDVNITGDLHLQSHVGIRSYNRWWQESNFGAIDTLKSENDVNQLIIPADISLSWSQSVNASLTVGGDLQDAIYYTWTNPLTGTEVYGNKANATQYGIYAQEELKLFGELTLRGGVRLAYIGNKVFLVNGGMPGDDRVSWNKLLWSAGARYVISEMLSVFSNAGTSFAVPGFKASCGTIKLSDFGIPGYNGQLPNPGLKPESGTGIDFGVDLKISNSIKLGGRIFYSIVQDAIVDNIVSENPSQTQSVNAGSSKAGGGELEFTQRINKEFDWFVNYTFISSETINNLNPDQSGTAIPFAPGNIFNLGLEYLSSFGLDLVPSLNYNSGFYDALDKSSRIFYKPGIVVNLYISQLIFKRQSFNLEFFARLSDITNNDYQLPWQFKNPGFEGMTGLKVIFR